MLAAKEPSHRPQFYRDLAGSELFVIQHGATSTENWKRTLQPGEKVSFRVVEREGRPMIPMFSSLPRLQAFIREHVFYVAMNSMHLFELTRGAAYVLNPGSEYGKEFTPEEPASIADGTIWKPSEQYVVEKETKVIVGQPARYPAELVAALSTYFRTKPEVRRAFLAHFFNPERDKEPHTLIAIETSGEWNDVAGGAGIVARAIVIPDPPLDFMQLTGKGGIEDHFRQKVKPFYEMKKFPGDVLGAVTAQ